MYLLSSARLMKIIRSFTKSTLPFFIFFSSSTIAQLKGNFWLPVQYRSLMPLLEKAVHSAENSSGCAKAISGSVILDRTTLESPVFAIICQDGKGRSFPMTFEGANFQKIQKNESQR